jgi:hypothetical protein
MGVAPLGGWAGGFMMLLRVCQGRRECDDCQQVDCLGGVSALQCGVCPGGDAAVPVLNGVLLFGKSVSKH